MKTASVTYSCRLTLGQYQHEELSVTLEPEPGEVVAGDELLRKAREFVSKNTTAYLNKERETKTPAEAPKWQGR